MKNFCITDPQNILSKEVWEKCQEILINKSTKSFYNAIKKALKELSNVDVWLYDTECRNLPNYICGNGKALSYKFRSISGLLCICELNQNVLNALKENSIQINKNVAIFKASGIKNIKVYDLDLPAIYIKTVDGKMFNTRETDEDDYDEDDGEDDCNLDYNDDALTNCCNE